MAQVVGSNRKRRLEAILVYAVLAVLVLAFVFPLIWVFGLSLKTRLQIFAKERPASKGRAHKGKTHR